MDSVLPPCACGCGEPVAKPGRRYVNYHYVRTRTAATYDAVHKSLRLKRGSASTYPCANCGEPAREWAFDNSEPRELDPLTNHYFSADLNRYTPLCNPCHVVLDHGWKRCPHGPDTPRYRSGGCIQCDRERTRAKESREVKDKRNARAREKYANDSEYRERHKAARSSAARSREAKDASNERERERRANDPEYRERKRRQSRERASRRKQPKTPESS